jgi:hypothetical protein
MMIRIEKNIKTPNIRRAILAAAVILSLCFMAGPAMSAENIDPEADRILQSMSTYLGGLSSFSVNSEVDDEIVDLEGQKLLWSSSGEIIAQRPQKLYVHRRGPFADMTIIFNGRTMTLNEKRHNVYAQIESPGTIEDAIRTVRFNTGLDAPAADLFYEDPYAGLITDVTKGAYLGTAYVNGVECHHLAFRAAKVDWQIWVMTGNVPLPMKYVITSKWVTAAPQYAVSFRDWNTSPKISKGLFEFSPPQGSRRLETIPVNEIGELMIEGGGK